MHMKLSWTHLWKLPWARSQAPADEHIKQRWWMPLGKDIMPLDKETQLLTVYIYEYIYIYYLFIYLYIYIQISSALSWQRADLHHLHPARYTILLLHCCIIPTSMIMYKSCSFKYGGMTYMSYIYISTVCIYI